MFYKPTKLKTVYYIVKLKQLGAQEKSTVQWHRKALRIAYNPDAQFSVAGRKVVVFVGGEIKGVVFCGG